MIHNNHDFDFKLKFTEVGKPFLIIDNFLTQEEYEIVINELDTIVRPAMRRHETGGAVDSDGNALKDTNACFVNDIYVNPMLSPTFKTLQKFHTDKDLNSKIANSHWTFEWLKDHGAEEHMQFLYYNDKDTYGDHVDIFNTSALLWLCKEPKGFEGGDFMIEKNHKVEFKNNRMVIFNFGTLHGVTPVKRTSLLDGHGRYCISKFMRPA